MKLPNCIATLVFIFMMMSSSVQADTTIVIVRHGEKPALGLGQLSCKGLNRALALAPLLMSRYGNPVAIYAPNPSFLNTDNGIHYAYVRPLVTIEPLAIRVGLPINIEWGMSDIKSLAERILSSPTGTHIVAWEHHWGESLAKHLLSKLGGDPDEVPRWDDADFDSVFVIRARDNEMAPRRVTFTHEQEGLDGLPEDCTDGPKRNNPHLTQ